MMGKTLLVFSSSISFCFLALGCFGVSRDFGALRNELIENNHYRFERDVELSFGPVSLWLAEQIGGLADVEDFPYEMLDEISGIQVGIYERDEGDESALRENNSDRSSFDNDFLKHLNDEMNDIGMEYIVKTVDGDDLNLIYINDDLSEGFNKLFVVTIDSEQLVLVELKGDLDKVMQMALRKKKLDFWK